jgi:predicted  nucleic acid-binding Zn-ribbon protein
MEYWILIQIILEFGLIVLVAVSLWKIRSWYRRIMALQAERPTREELARMAELAEDIGKRHQDLEELLAHLEQKASAFKKQLSRAESRPAPGPGLTSAWENGLSLRSQVETLHRQGCSTEEIARRLQLNLAEVKMALDLSRARSK